MSAPSASRNPWSLSLRGLLLAVALAGLACVSLKFANDWFWIGLSGAAMLLFMAAAVVAFVGRGAGQAFAIGFVLCMGIYCGALFASGPDPYAGALPTTKLLRPAFEAIVTFEYVVVGSMGIYDPTRRFATQAEAVAYQSANRGTTVSMGFSGGGGVSGMETPTRESFMAVAHVWWAVLFGYLGGRLARLVYLRRVAESH